MSEVMEERKKARKKALFKLNRVHEDLFQLARFRRVDDERVKGLELAKKSKPEQEKETEWGDKVASVRNRLNGKKRISRERWNRFAGTGGEGGRGL
jgi:hypothetical protein